MYSVKIRDHIMIAHSLPSEAFGPAQALHGATYVVDAIFKSIKLDANNIVIDIGLAQTVLKNVLSPLNYQNLDQYAEFDGQLTTTEFIAKHIHDELKKELRRHNDFNGAIEVILGESHIAWASYSE